MYVVKCRYASVSLYIYMYMYVCDCIWELRVWLVQYVGTGVWFSVWV